MPWYLISAVAAILFSGLALRFWLAFRDATRFRERQDSLTRLPNRIALEEVLGGVIADQQDGGSFALLVIALDAFSRVNELYGYHRGDAFLVSVAHRLRGLAGAGSVAVRMGGDEFALALVGAPGQAAVNESAAAVLRAVEECVEEGFQRAPVSSSIGISLFPGSVRTADEAIRMADLAMRDVKRRGGSSVGFAGSSAKRETAALNEIRGHCTEALIRSALDHNGFRLMFQPIVDRHDRIAQMEALVRIHDRTLGVVPPGEFIGAAERTGLIHEMGRWILAEACRHARAWQDAGRPVQVTVKVSPVELDKVGFIEFTTQTLRDAGLDGASLVLEVMVSPDSALSEQARTCLLAARKAGIAIATDGAATAIPGADIVKIACEAGSSGARVTRRSGLRIAVTCIEEFRQMEQARTLDCDYFQGYLIAPPLEPEDATQFLMARNAPSERRQNPVGQSKLQLFDTLPGGTG